MLEPCQAIGYVRFICCELDMLKELLAPLGEHSPGHEHGTERRVAEASALSGFAIRLDHEFAECPLVRAEDPEALRI